jgi:hypothetical protein
MIRKGTLSLVPGVVCIGLLMASLGIPTVLGYRAPYRTLPRPTSTPSGGFSSASEGSLAPVLVLFVLFGTISGLIIFTTKKKH